MRLLPLPTDRARSPAIYRGASEALALSSDLARAFDRTGNSTHEDIVSTLLSAFAVLVHRYCHEDVLVGVPLSTANPDATGVFDRSRSDLLPIRVRMADDPEAGAVVERVRTALRHAGTEPGLVSTSAAQRDPFLRNGCIATRYQVVFDYSAALPDGRISTGLEEDRAENGANAAGEELSMRVAGGRGRFDGRIDYNAELFEATTIRRMAAHFLMLLRGMLENPEKRISMLPLLTAGEREQLLTDWNRPAAAGPSRPRKFLHEAFESQVAQTPEAVAIIAGSERLTYRDLDGEANKFANYLRERRVGADVLVGISLERSPKLVIALLGILKAGGAYVPLEPSYPPAQLKTLVEQVQPALIVTQQRFLPHHACSRITTLLLDSEQAAIDASASVSPGVRVTGDNLATVIFSSGSTGMPKAIAQRHAAMAHDPRSSAPFEIRASDRHVLKTTLDSTLLVREIFWPLLTGGTMVIAEAGKTADVAPLLKVLREERITLITLVPSLLRLLVDSGGLQACTGLRHVACFGEPLPADLEKRFRDTLSAELWSYYGTTEAPTLALRRCSRGGVRPLGNLGYPIPGKKIYVLDANLEPVPIGVPGELYAGGPNLAIGYLNEAATANARFVRNPFVDDSTARMYRTGDRVRWREDGSLEFIGRADDQLKIRGYRVEPAEVESALLCNPGVREVAVVAKPNKAGENELAAYFVATQQALTIADLRSFIENRLPAHAVPSTFVRMEELPRRPNGKVDRQALPDPVRVRPETSEGLIPPRTPVETALAEIWRDVLGVGSIGVNDNFFALGGHSMLAARTVERIERAFGRRLALNAFWYDGGTIAGQAALLGAGGNSGAASVLVPIKPTGNKPCLFVAHTIGGNVFHYYALAAALHPEQPVIGLQARGVDGSGSPRRKIEDIAADCIAAMRERQPRGPFFIAGYSSGGVVAFEIAQQLATAGDDVGLLALLDAFGPRVRIRRSRWRTTMSRILHPRPRLLQEKVYHAFLRRLGLDHRRQLTKVGEAQRWAHWSYRARPYRGSVLVITARDSSEMVGDPVLGWGNLVRGGARLRLVPATHGSLLQVPTVADVAAMLQAELDAATARSGQAEC